MIIKEYERERTRPLKIRAQRLFYLAIVVGFFCLASRLVSAEAIIHTCGLPNTYGTATIPAKNQLGEFLIQLKPPEYRDRNSVREHLIFSRVWARIIRSNLQAKTRDCDAILDASLFPGLSAYLMIGTPRDVLSDRAMCIGALQDAITQSERDISIIKKAASDEFSLVQRWSESRGNFIVEADNILRQAMRLIFDYGTTMEALASVGALEFQEINSQGFEEWLRNQRASFRIARIKFSTCNEISETLPNQEHVIEVHRLPNSSVIKPSLINIKDARRENDAILHKLVVIGLKTPSFLPGVTTVVQADVLTGYCNRERSFFNNLRNDEITVTVRCLRVVKFTRPWVVLFCDPKDCSTKEAAEVVASAIVKDPAILALVQANTENSQAIGPYLVNVE